MRCFKIGLITFGGGLAMLPILERELVDKRNWATKERMMDYLQSVNLLGIIAVNVATFIGYERTGFLGALLAAVGVVTPSLIVISVIAMLLSGFADNIYVKSADRYKYCCCRASLKLYGLFVLLSLNL